MVFFGEKKILSANLIEKIFCPRNGQKKTIAPSPFKLNGCSLSIKIHFFLSQDTLFVFLVYKKVEGVDRGYRLPVLIFFFSHHPAPIPLSFSSNPLSPSSHHLVSHPVVSQLQPSCLLAPTPSSPSSRFNLAVRPLILLSKDSRLLLAPCTSYRDFNLK